MTLIFKKPRAIFEWSVWAFILLRPWYLNAVEDSSSPYVRERLQDPIHWHSWNEETRFALKKSGRPGLFSISHELNALSHAMGKESFGNEDIAGQVNEHFFAIAVDKNEYPLLAEFFATYVWTENQISGWPLTVFVTPELQPITGGGYYPPTDDWGSQGFSSIVNSIAEQWKGDRDLLMRKAESGIIELDRARGPASNPAVEFKPGLLSVVVENLGLHYDSVHGGFSLPPKAVSFKPFQLLKLAMESGGAIAESAKPMHDKTLKAVLTGAMRDFVRGGFFAESTEESWTIPDFRKSVRVQAEAIGYLSLYPEYNDIVEETAQVLVDDFRTVQGLYCELIAFSVDSSTVNSWSYTDLSTILDEDELKVFAECFGVKPEGNVPGEMDILGVFKGRNILSINAGDLRNTLVVSAREKLKAASQSMYKPRQEQMSSVDINALVASAFSKAGPSFEKNGLVLLEQMIDLFWDGNAQLLRASAANGEVSSIEASARGYALFVQALLDYDKTSTAQAVQAVLDRRFATELGPYLMGPRESSGIPLNVYGYLEDRTGSVNSISIGNHRRLSIVGSIHNHLPEEVTYAPELFPSLIAALFRK